MKYTGDIRYKVLHLIQIVIFIAAVLATMSNVLNRRPVWVILTPVSGALFLLFLFYLKKRKPYLSKILFLIYFDLILLPVIWIFSPGVSSAATNYAIMTVVLSVFFAEKPVEYTLPFISLIFSIFMIRFELAHPDFFEPFISRRIRFNDLTYNFAIVTVMIAVAMVYVNRSYEKEKKFYLNKSITDDLTSLYNRRYCFEFGENLFAQYLRHRHRFVVAMMDLDLFKKINDRYGHDAGDEVLKAFSELLKKESRRGDVCSRIGGEEFTVIFPESTLEEAHIMAERFRKTLEETAIKTEKGLIKITCSIGLCAINNSMDSFSDVLKGSDENLYKAKKAGRNQTIPGV